MKQLYTWGAVAAIVLASTIGDVLLSRAMKQVGDVHDLWNCVLSFVAKRVDDHPATY